MSKLLWTPYFSFNFSEQGTFRHTYNEMHEFEAYHAIGLLRFTSYFCEENANKWYMKLLSLIIRVEEVHIFSTQNNHITTNH